MRPNEVGRGDRPSQKQEQHDGTAGTEANVHATDLSKYGLDHSPAQAAAAGWFALESAVIGVSVLRGCKERSFYVRIVNSARNSADSALRAHPV